MKYSFLLLLLGLLAAASAKPHGEGKRTHVTKRTREHELSNRMGHGDHHRRDHNMGHKMDSHKNNSTHSAHRSVQHKLEGAHKAEARKALAHRNPNAKRGTKVGTTDANNNHDLKDLQLQHITEHNIERKHEDKDGIPMETERLIHVTPRPPKAHKVNKNHHKMSQAAGAMTPDPSAFSNNPVVKPKGYKPPKKYSPKKHGWKKSLRKEKSKDKSKDKAKEKRERREKRNKALHRAVMARKL